LTSSHKTDLSAPLQPFVVYATKGCSTFAGAEALGSVAGGAVKRGIGTSQSAVARVSADFRPRFLRPVQDDLDDLADVGALAFFRARAQIFLAEALARTVFGSEQSLLEHGAVIQIEKVASPEREGSVADVVEEKQPFPLIVSVDLVADEFQRGVFKKGRP
jgi:hypothetical protein